MGAGGSLSVVIGGRYDVFRAREVEDDEGRVLVEMGCGSRMGDVIVMEGSRATNGQIVGRESLIYVLVSVMRLRGAGCRMRRSDVGELCKAYY